MTIFDVSGLPDVRRAAFRSLTATLGDFTVIGMTAVDLVTRGLANLPASRLTRDVDVAIAVDSERAFRERTRGLVPLGKELGVHFRLDDDLVDVVPFGGLAPGDALTIADQELDVSGLAEAAGTALVLRLDEDLVVRVASLPALVVLKLFAWYDRGLATGDQDAHDAALLLSASVSGRFADDLWEDDDALEQTVFDPERTGPFRVGRQIVEQFPERVVARLVDILSGASGTRLHDVLARASLRTDDHLDALLHGLRSGTHEARG